MNKKNAFITGVTGQDGSYLSDLLIEKGYEVHGLVRHSSINNTERINHLLLNKSFYLHKGDLTDYSSLERLLREIKPDEIYNLAAQSHVAVSFEEPELTTNINALGTLRLLEIIKNSNLKNNSKFYQASTSELFGKIVQCPQNENTPFYPRSPYGVSKLFAYWITVNYREAYGLYACNGILFNHESPRRGEEFVTKKIIRTLTKIKHGIESCLYIGNLDSKRDWGHAKDYVEMQWLMLQQKEPEDFVISTGEQITVRDFINIVLQKLNIKVSWKGKDLEEYAIDENENCIVKVDPKFFRPAEVSNLLGDSMNARNKLGWNPKYNLNDLVDEMIEYEITRIHNEK